LKSASMDLETLQQSVPDEHSGEEEDTESDEPLQLEEFLAERISELQPTSPDIVRATPAYQGLRRCGAALRGERQDSYHRSFETSRIASFWSHSWHGSKWRKVVTALWVYNSVPATYVSTIGAFLVSLLYGLKVLPGMSYWDSYEYPRSYWASSVGLVLYCLTFLFWQPRQHIFLDVLCIDQIDPTRKAAGILSMGAFLKCSDSMLVLWDPTYTHRLWCIYELSAYLYSRPEGAKTNLTARPVLLGPCYMLLTLALCCFTLAVASIPERNEALLWIIQAVILAVGFYPNVAAYRQYFRTLGDLKSELESFSLQGTHCMCCQRGHVSADGEPMACDRKVVLHCLKLWFGSAESFEHRVRSEVSETLMHELAAEFFNYRRCVAALIPVAWSYMDTASAEWRKYEDPRHRGTEVTKELARGFAWWLCVAPSILLMTFRLAYCFLAKRSSRCCDWAVNILILLCIVAFFVAAVQLEFACMIFHNDFVPEDSWWRGLHTAMLLFVALCLPMAILLFNCVGLQPPITTQKAAVSGNAEETRARDGHVREL